MLLKERLAVRQLITVASTGIAYKALSEGGVGLTVEPFFKSLLIALYRERIHNMVSKARVLVPPSSARLMMGVMDETGTLEPGQVVPFVYECLQHSRGGGRELGIGSAFKASWLLAVLTRIVFFKEAVNSLNHNLPSRLQVFVQFSPPSSLVLDEDSEFYNYEFGASDKTVLTGPVVVTRNPCLHPGDVRVLEAVDAPGLMHLLDCVVFPRKGPRPHPNEMAGKMGTWNARAWVLHFCY